VDSGTIQPVFSPKGPSLAQLAATRLGAAKRRIRILTPVMTAGPVLGTLAELAGRHSFDLAGAYDLTQMEEVQDQWRRVPSNHWKLEAWKVIAPRLSGKRSTPYADGSVHDYMHAKVIVADGHVLTGSYNLSRGGAENAENVLAIDNGAVAERFAEFADQVAARYASAAPMSPGSA
jgi:phosphatidylserine/phosphatidylglycerophosphate/cardiolipin synthase-like enzyme